MLAMLRAPKLFSLAALLWTSLLLVPTHCDDQESVPKEAAAAADDENDPTKQLLKQLTIGMMEVVDERTVLLRPTSSKNKKAVHLRLGNAGPVPRGSLSDGEYAEKVTAAKDALTKLVDRQALWYKAAPESAQSLSESPDVIIADIWNKGGRHINTAMKKEGHLSDVKEYESELARDILGAAAKDEKEASYKKLGEVMAEHEKAQKEAKKEADKAAKAKAKAEEDAEDAAEGFGLGGWIGIALVLGLVVGVATNFGRKPKGKTNLNRKKSWFERTRTLSKKNEE